jgi:hypothetical protein
VTRAHHTLWSSSLDVELGVDSTLRNVSKSRNVTRV